MSRPSVVIVGGGYAGAALAKDLDAKANVTLIERREAFFHVVGSLRASVDPKFGQQILIPYNALLRHGKVLHEEVAEITEKEVKFVNAAVAPITFDYLVIATGSTNKFPAIAPAAKNAALANWQQSSEQIKQAEKVLIVGGGAVGLELAGEIRHLYPNKEITVIHSGDKLASPALNAKFQTKLNAHLTKLRINVILDDRVNNEDLPDPTIPPSVNRKTYTTRNGKSVEADLCFVCVGHTVNNSTLKAHFTDKLDTTGRLKVNPFFQVEGYTNIFAAGDISNVAEAKMAFTAGLHAEHISKTIMLLHNKKPLQKGYVPAPAVMLVPLGPNGGVGQMPNGWVVGDCISKMIKSKSLFAQQNWKLLNAKPPK
eukprot:TRINITY_DN4007_c0_g1::TRINITY_DN4007_c0_g1_i1::g.11844::m.11844 TRINITY_DN4007_c0_g1::TRINITY_DN4007_c0_g1_i1::g.11844  ORF type:complete len:389 (+),score=81.92,sp/Q54NS8/AIFB_DICDI/40.99/4e-82,Pyr_redox_2/PF07992.9/1.6e-18,Pyr_redox_2/PF07992.9/6.2e+03,Pyr_redox/PF00070.22/0.00062,Pyr_redox/PF00070.22/8.8e-12,K_oxygenase/PF13434.1/0.2,K_oxygenase/PF13434.1/0.00016,NAD_binding_7/PF13241.1/0.14,NAD_binding_7/PF13241.1/0.11,Pyr_redox_3/PF13738.1/17,Pyr_redox_3/PF13738.1/0.00075,Lycopene_cycl/PF05